MVFISYFYLTEAFWTFLTFSCIYSLFINLPFGVFMIYLFFRPALYVYQDLKLIKIFLFLFFFNYFIYFFIILPWGIPSIFSFFKNFENLHVQYIPTLWNLFVFYSKISIVFFLSLNLPFWISVLEKNYINNRIKYFLILSIIIAFLTPPDIFSLFFVLSPLIIILEIIIWIKFMF